MSKWLEKTWVRMLGMIVLGLIFGGLVSEISFWASSDLNDFKPHQVELVIPAGTAEKLKEGKPLSIPDTMNFVEGDVLIVRNQDVVSHQLGPVWVPPQASGALQIGKSNNYAYECTFTRTKVFGLDVQPPLTLWMRLQGMISIGLPTGVMLALYVLAVPRKNSGTVAEAAQEV
jgi:hypothetical protein